MIYIWQRLWIYAIFVHVHCIHSIDLVTHPQYLEPSVYEGDGEREKEREGEKEGEREGRRERGRERARERLRCMWLCLINTVC